jgi:ell wall binding domain 2 (CWB2)
MYRRLAAAMACATAALAGLAAPLAAAPSPTEPAAWPKVPGLSPRMVATSNSVRLTGNDRYETNLAAVLAVRGRGGLPFTSPDPGSTNLTASSAWWGLNSCPRAVIITAGDSFADSLSATSLSAPNARGVGPLLERVAAADPLFDVPGGFARLDLFRAPIVLTQSGRQGATRLGATARTAVADLARGGCTTARVAVIVGGPSAVPVGVEADLLSLGVTEVFRLAGANRFDTAGKVATAMGTSPIPPSVTSCASVGTLEGPTRMFNPAPSVVEDHTSATSCRLLGRSIVLTDGITGADALAAGWWTSFHQVPLLYVDNGGVLPQATKDALAIMEIENIIVLGGTTRVPDAVAAEAAGLARGAAITRISGSDRTGTSLEMARRFGGWWSTGQGQSYAGSMICLASSAGSGAAATGWPDALAAGPWCGAANGAAANPNAPVRALAPVNGVAPRTTAGLVTRPARDAVPVILLPPGQSDLPASVREFLTDAFVPGSGWCSSVTAAPACLAPGFVVVFGDGVGQGAEAAAATLVSGSVAPIGPERTPSIAEPFVTDLDMAPVYTGAAAVRSACFARGALNSVRWLQSLKAAGDQEQAVDVFTAGIYRADADAKARSPRQSAPVCVPVGTSSAPSVRGVSMSGWASDRRQVVYADDPLTLSGTVTQSSPSSVTGAPGELATPGAATSWTYSSAPAGLVLSVGVAPRPVTQAAIGVTYRRGPDAGTLIRTDTCSGAISLTTAQGAVTGSFGGELLVVGSKVMCRAPIAMIGFDDRGTVVRGAIAIDLSLGAPGAPDDVISWRFDAIEG